MSKYLSIVQLGRTADCKSVGRGFKSHSGEGSNFGLLIFKLRINIYLLLLSLQCLTTINATLNCNRSNILIFFADVINFVGVNFDNSSNLYDF